MRSAIERLHLDLRGSVVLTEAATGAYVVTPALAAMAGADRVYALTRTTRYGSAEQVRQETLALAALHGVEGRIEVREDRDPALFAAADIITNSGHVRPIGRELFARLKPTAVIPLMYEAWEFRPDDLDIEACAEYGIAIGGTNERNPDVDVFSFLGILTVKLLLDSGVSVYGTHLLLLCDNAFAAFIERGLSGAGARVDVASRVTEAPPDGAYDAVVVSLTPRWSGESVLTRDETFELGRRWPGAVVAQVWGDLDRETLAQQDIRVWPERAPGHGHMAILLSDIGPDSVVRLQSGGLKVGEVLWRQRRDGKSVGDSVAALQASGYGHALEL